MDANFDFGMDLHSFFHVLVLLLLSAALFYVVMRGLRRLGGSQTEERDRKRRNRSPRADHRRDADKLDRPKRP